MGNVMGDLTRAARHGAGHGRHRAAAAASWSRAESAAVGDVRLLDRRCARNTQGRATYTMVFDRYEEVPSHIAEKVVEARSGGEQAA